MSGTRDGFRYTALETQPHQIRILALLPGSWGDDIKCRLHKAFLDDNPKYEALSYTWGDPYDKKEITLDGRLFKVTSNLELALRYLRRPSEKRLLWVDALCIDQTNNDEKSHQVGMMRLVYKEASQVNIWLGHIESEFSIPELPSSSPSKWRCQGMTKIFEWILSPFLHPIHSTAAPKDYSENLLEGAEDPKIDPFSFVHHFNEDKHLHDLSCFYRSSITNRLRFTETPLFLEQWSTFRRLLNCRWWFRFWCVQEALLGQHSVVYWGHWQIEWSTIKNAIRNHMRHLTTCCSEAEKLMGFTYYFEPDRLLIESGSIFGNATLQTPSQINDLEMLLREYRYKDCKDPRDKVYGILGVVDKSTYRNLRPDYSLGVREVYISAMRAIISQHTEGLRFLTGEGFNSSHHDLPSWVRDFSHLPDISVLRHEMNRMEAYYLYHCSRSRKSPAFIENSLYLHIKGVQIDTVAAVGSPLKNLDWRCVGSVLESWHHLAGVRIFERPWAHERQRAFWRTVLADTVFDVESKQFRRCSAKDINEFHKWLMQVLVTWGVGLQPPMKDCFVLAFLAATYGRAMFITSTGRAGLSYDTVKEGDEIWACHGGMVPFILRNRSVMPDGFRALIGDCYLDCFMDGEAFRSAHDLRQVVLS